MLKTVDRQVKDGMQPCLRLWTNHERGGMAVLKTVHLGSKE